MGWEPRPRRWGRGEKDWGESFASSRRSAGQRAVVAWFRVVSDDTFRLAAGCRGSTAGVSRKCVVWRLTVYVHHGRMAFKDGTIIRKQRPDGRVCHSFGERLRKIGTSGVLRRTLAVGISASIWRWRRPGATAACHLIGGSGFSPVRLHDVIAIPLTEMHPNTPDRRLRKCDDGQLFRERCQVAREATPLGHSCRLPEFHVEALAG